MVAVASQFGHRLGFLAVGRTVVAVPATRRHVACARRVGALLRSWHRLPPVVCGRKGRSSPQGNWRGGGLAEAERRAEKSDVRNFLAALVCSVAVLTVADRAVNGRGLAAADGNAVLARGAYLVDDVAKCGTCHTPRDDQDKPDARRPLSGGPVPYRPVRDTAEWADVAPRLAGLPPGNDEEVVHLLMTGISRTGRPPRPPMPQFRLTRGDAEAVLAYLKSLPSTY
jgi:mono/diheme cytochrome c family protein